MQKNKKLLTPSLAVAILSGLGIISFLTLIFITNLCHFTYQLNADNASDVVLGKLIWETKEWIPRSWYPGAELRLLLTPNLSALFYGLTQNAVLATGLSCCAMTLGIVLSIWYGMSSLKMHPGAKLLVVFLCLMLPGDLHMLELTYLFAAYYATHVIVLFLTLGFYHRCLAGCFNWPVFLILSGLALVLGMQGVRGILITFGPLFGVEIVRCLARFRKKHFGQTDFRILGMTFFFLVMSVIGTLFPFSIGQEVRRNIRQGITKLLTVVLPDVRQAIGFDVQPFWGKVVLGVFCLMVVTELVLLVGKLLRQSELPPLEWLELVLMVSPILTALAVSFTTVESSYRYYFGLHFIIAVCLGKYAGRINPKKVIPTILAGGMAGGIFLLSCFNIERNYLPILKEDASRHQTSLAVIDWLRENEYPIAYTNFENANTLTVFSNCEIIVAAVGDIATMEICKWVSSTAWYVPNRPYQEKTAYIITERNRERFLAFLEKNNYDKDITTEVQIGHYWIFTAPYNFSSL